MDATVPILAPNEPAAPVIPVTRLARLLRRYAWIVLGCALLGGIGALAYSHSLPKTFTANGVVTVEGTGFAIPQLQGALRQDNAPDPMPYVHTEVEALGSRALLAEVVSQLHLDAVPEFNPALQPPSLKDRFKSLIAELFVFRSPEAVPPEVAEAAAQDAVISTVGRALSIFQDNRSLVISVSFTARDPTLAAKVVNTLISDYIAARASHRTKIDTGASTALSERVARARADLEEIEQKMQALRSNQDLVGLRAGSVGQQQVEELTTALSRVSVEKTQVQLNYDRALAATKAGTADALASVLNSPTIATLREQEATAARRLADLSAQFGSAYPGMQSATAALGSVRAQIANEGARIVASLGAQLRVLSAQEADLQQQLAQARARAVSAENDSARLDQLKQEEETRRALYQSLLEAQERTVAQPAADATPDVRVISPASIPGLPSGPHMLLAGVLGAGGGACLGCLLALTRLRRMAGFFTPDEVTALTGLPVLLTLPRTLIRRAHGILANARRRTPVQIAGAQELETLRVLRNRLRLIGRTRVPRCLVFLPVSSGLEASHAAPLAAAFARSAAGDGERVLLIEGSLDEPELARALGVKACRWQKAEPGGILAVIAGWEWRAVIERDRQPALDLLLATGRVANSLELVTSARFQNLLVEAAVEYDLVVLYAPPAMDPCGPALVRRADAGVLVVDARLDAEAARDAALRVSEASAAPLAAVLVARA